MAITGRQDVERIGAVIYGRDVRARVMDTGDELREDWGEVEYVRAHRAAQYDCPRCWGTGSLESSDSTEDGWWDCSTCKGTGKVADRRRPDPRLREAVELIERFAAHDLPGNPPNDLLDLFIAAEDFVREVESP